MTTLRPIDELNNHIKRIKIINNLNLKYLIVGSKHRFEGTKVLKKHEIRKRFRKKKDNLYEIHSY
jgi:hypothetical protein